PRPAARSTAPARRCARPVGGPTGVPAASYGISPAAPAFARESRSTPAGASPGEQKHADSYTQRRGRRRVRPCNAGAPPCRTPPLDESTRTTAPAPAQPRTPGQAGRPDERAVQRLRAGDGGAVRRGLGGLGRRLSAQPDRAGGQKPTPAYPRSEER